MTKLIPIALCGLLFGMLAKVGLFMNSPDTKTDSHWPAYRRIISLAPSMTETLISLGAADRLIGITAHCPKSRVQNAEVIGTFAEPNFEVILALKPDLVLAVPHIMARETIKKLELNDIKVFSHQPDSLADIKVIITSLADMLRMQGSGAKLTQKIDDAVNQARDMISKAGINARGDTVLIAISHQPLVVAGKHSFPSQIVEELGLKNLSDKGSSAWPIWPLENMLLKPPHYLILANGQADLPAFLNMFSALGIEQPFKSMQVIAPKHPIFASPSPVIIEDTQYLVELLRSSI